MSFPGSLQFYTVELDPFLKVTCLLKLSVFSSDFITRTVIYLFYINGSCIQLMTDKCRRMLTVTVPNTVLKVLLQTFIFNVFSPTVRTDFYNSHALLHPEKNACEKYHCGMQPHK